jgi:hypothetical protein
MWYFSIGYHISFCLSDLVASMVAWVRFDTGSDSTISFKKKVN